MKLLAQILFIARFEGRLFIRHPKLIPAAIAVILIPAIYIVIYLSSVWDPASRTGLLAVGLVNLDQGMVYQKQIFNIGNEVITELKASHQFGYKEYSDEQLARQDVRQGKLAFALIIPPNFSANAVPGTEPGAGKPVIFSSEGNNYQSATLARHFAETLGHRINEKLNEQRWALVLLTAVGSQQGVDRLKSAVTQLSLGAKKLSKGATETATGARKVAHGSTRVTEGVGQLTSGFKQIDTGLKTINTRLPSNRDLNRLRNGGNALVAGHRELGKGLAELQNGNKQLYSGVETFQEEAKQSFFVSSETLTNIEKLTDGLGQMNTGLTTASDAQKKLTNGAVQLNTGIGSIVSGLRTLTSEIQTAASKLPEDDQLDELAKGTKELATGTVLVSGATQKVASGAQQLSAGIEQLAGELPSNVNTPDGSPEGLANSVKPVLEMHAAVANSGSGFSANVIPAALWLGAGIAVFLLHVRLLPSQAQPFSKISKLLGKLIIPGSIVMLQAVCIFLTIHYILGMHIEKPGVLALTLGIASFTFLLIVIALTRAFGDTGKGIAMLLLVVQLSSSGGMLPVELSGGWHMYISPWLPLTWVVRAVKASMFGAYDGIWHYPVFLVGMVGVVAALLACVIGRWRFADQNEIRPAIDI